MDFAEAVGVVSPGALDVGAAAHRAGADMIAASAVGVGADGSCMWVLMELVIWVLLTNTIRVGAAEDMSAAGVVGLC
jgi:hypothetical protein